MVTAAIVGVNVDRICEKTGYSVMFVREVVRRMHDSGLWIGDEVRWWDWVAEPRDFETFWRESLVAAGLWVTRQVHGTTVFIPVRARSSPDSCAE